ncbi:fimbria/pilus outer membrane usher protein [Hyphomicrobium sulfonivorans]|nr:fimbria/pilus outer membrane usher protein [Hyphomicrobium sulfonivorans]
MPVNSFARPVSNRLNQTGRVVTMPVVVSVDGSERGEVNLRIDHNDNVSVNVEELVGVVGDTLDETERNRLAAAGAEGGFVSLEVIRRAGFDVRFDQALLELSFAPAVEQRPVGEIDFGHQRRKQTGSAVPMLPAFASGYLNVYAGFDYVWGAAPLSRGGWGDGAVLNGRMELDSAVRIGGVVLENRALYGSALQADPCPLIVGCIYGQRAGFQRQLSRLIYDMPGEVTRVQLGDVDPMGVGVQGAPDLLGISAEKSYRKLAPATSITPVNQNVFRIDRPSTVEVIVNSAVLQSMRLQPGNYNVRDLPLMAGANHIELSITDDMGNNRVIATSAFFDANLLAPGLFEWGVALGAPSYFLNSARTYEFDLFMGTAFMRYGVSDELTLLGYAQSDAYVTTMGTQALRATPWGMLGTGLAASTGALGSGIAATLDFARVRVSGIFSDAESVIVSVKYQTPEFQTPGQFLTSSEQVLYSQLHYALRFDAAYTTQLYADTTATLAARLQLSDPNQLILGFNGWQDNRFGADLTLSRPITANAISSLTIGVSNETYLNTPILSASPAPELRVGLRLTVRPDEQTTIAAGYDTLNQQAIANVYRNTGQGIDRWDASVNVENRAGNNGSTVTAGAGYYGNRADVHLTHSAGMSGVAFTDFYGSSGNQRTSLRVGSAIAFVDDRVAVGAPIKGDAFALVHPHETIGDREVIVGSRDLVLAKSDSFGPAVLSGLPAYSQNSISVDVDDLPTGYSIGPGAYDTKAPYKGGYDIEVGSTYSVVAYGRLVNQNGTPLELAVGVVHPINNPRKRVPIFTNRSGKFAADGVAAGRWIIEIELDTGKVPYILDIPESVEGLHKAGTLRPSPEV